MKSVTHQAFSFSLLNPFSFSLEVRTIGVGNKYTWGKGVLREDGRILKFDTNAE